VVAHVTCCPVGKHAQAADIDRAIRAQQAATQANASTSAPSYSQIARTYGIRKATLFAHRDECLANRSGVPVRVDSVPLRTAGEASDGNESDVAAVDRYAVAASVHGAEAAGEQAGRATGPPRRPDQRARARTPYDQRWDVVGAKSIDAAVERVTHVIADSELTDPNSPRAHATYVQEIVELIERDEWDGELTASRLARSWQKPKMFVLGCYRDAVTLMRIARGSPNEDREVSLRRWIKLFRAAMDKGDPLALKVAADALKGYDAASGIVDKSTRVQVNVMQDPQAQEMLRVVFDVVREDPVMLERIRARLMALPGAAGELPAVEVIDAAK
jgi:hypothetical protein